jgi:hypothetical protein
MSLIFDKSDEILKLENQNFNIRNKIRSNKDDKKIKNWRAKCKENNYKILILKTELKVLLEKLENQPLNLSNIEI